MPQRISDEDLEWMIKDNLYRDIDKMALDLRDDRAALTIAVEALEKVDDSCCHYETYYEHEVKKEWCSQHIARTALNTIKRFQKV